MALRARHEAGEIDAVEVRRRVTEEARALLLRSPRDSELLHVVRALAARGFIPAPPATLPTGTAAEVRRALLRRTADERRALASAMVVVPDAADAPAQAIATLELFLLVPEEGERAAALIAALEGRGHDVSLARAELAMRRLDPRALLAPADEAWARVFDAASEAHRAEVIGRAAARAVELLAQSTQDARTPFGAEWLVPIQDSTAVANHTLAFQRRPALAHELGALGRHLAAMPDAAPEALDPEDRAKVLAARAAVLGDAVDRSATVEDPARPLAWPLAPVPRSGLAARLETLARGTGDRDALDAGALELLGDRRAAAKAWLGLGGDISALAHATRLEAELAPRDRQALVAKLRERAIDDEARYVDPDVRRAAELALALEPDRWLAVRLSAMAPAPAPIVAEPASPPESDPHHPESRLAAASDLLAAGKLEPAGNVLAALVRKADEHPPARLFLVVAQALEAEEPPPELVTAAERALLDDRRRGPLLAALLQRPSAAFALHDALLAYAQDPSRADADRLAALEVWLAIWRATETPPDPDGLRSLREAEPALVVAAAIRLGKPRDALAALGAFLAAHRDDTPDAFSAALLALSLGKT